MQTERRRFLPELARASASSVALQHKQHEEYEEVNYDQLDRAARLGDSGLWRRSCQQCDRRSDYYCLVVLRAATRVARVEPYQRFAPGRPTVTQCSRWLYSGGR